MKTQNNPITESTAVKSNVEKKGMSPLWQSVLVGGVPGILIGSGGTVGVEAIANSASAEEQGEVAIQDEATVETTEILEAHSVTDDMSFSEAFATARAEVGPGGAFVWHGQVYAPAAYHTSAYRFPCLPAPRFLLLPWALLTDSRQR